MKKEKMGSKNKRKRQQGLSTQDIIKIKNNIDTLAGETISMRYVLFSVLRVNKEV